MLDYEDYINSVEPSAMELILSEAKDRIKEVIKHQIKHEIDCLKKENELLKSENEKFRSKEMLIRQKEFSLNNKEKELEHNFNKMKLTDLISEALDRIEVFAPDYEYIHGEKCDKCNDNREIIYRSDSGDELGVRCKCDEKHINYFPTSKMLSTISIGKSRYDNKYSVSYKHMGSIGDESGTFRVSRCVSELNGELLKDLKYYEDSVRTMELCQQWCDYLNEESRKNRVKYNGN